MGQCNNRGWRRPQYIFSASLMYGSLVALVYYFQGVGGLAPQFLLMIPYVGGILMLGLGRRIAITASPSSLGRPYSRTE